MSLTNQATEDTQMNKYDQMTKIKHIIESCNTLEQLQMTRDLLERFRIMYVRSDNIGSIKCATELRNAWRVKSRQFDTVATKTHNEYIPTEENPNEIHH